MAATARVPSGSVVSRSVERIITAVAMGAVGWFLQNYVETKPAQELSAREQVGRYELGDEIRELSRALGKAEGRADYCEAEFDAHISVEEYVR